MSDEPVCLKCLAEEAARYILEQFTDEYPDIAMPLAAWNDLREIAEAHIKIALGIKEADEIGEAGREKATVQ